MFRKTTYDHYKLLGVSNWASEAEIKQAYREKVKFCHPDRNRSPRAAEAFHAVHNAYTTLIDPKARDRYDETLRFSRPAKKDHRYGTVDRSTRERRATRPKEEVVYVTPFMFYTLHAVGLLFGLAVVSRTVVGFTLEDWPFYMAIFLIPGLAILPDSFAGLRKMS